MPNPLRAGSGWLLAAVMTADLVAQVPPPSAPAPVLPALDERSTNPPEPDSDGFLPLLHAEDLRGWTPKIRGYPFGTNFGDTFRVEDGVLQVRYDAYETFDGRFGHLFHEVAWSRYVLRFEYRFVGEQIEGGAGWALRNSGVMLHCQDPQSMREDQDFPVSIEAQLLGGDGRAERSTLNLCTPGTHVVMAGELIRRHCTNSRSATYHGERWVAVEIEVLGAERIRHRIDGELVLEYEQPQLDPTDPDAARLIESRDGERRLSEGFISLQSESHPCDFRNIRIKPLPHDAAGVERQRSVAPAAVDPGVDPGVGPGVDPGGPVRRQQH